MAKNFKKEASMSDKKKEEPKHGEPVSAGDVVLAAGVAGGLGGLIGLLAAGPIGAIGLGLIYAGVIGLCAATEHEPDTYDLG